MFTSSSALPSGRIFYIAPEASGNKDGSSWSNAARLSDLPKLLEAANPGDQVWIRGDQGAYALDRPIQLKHGGTADQPIVIRGVNVDGTDSATPLLVGDRATNWEPGLCDGQEVFRLLQGADHLEFANLNFKNVGNGAFRIAQDITNLTIRDMEAENVRRFIENTASPGAMTATVSGLTVKNVAVRGFSKGVIRLRYDSHDILIEDVVGDAASQNGEEFITGVHLDGTVHDVMHRRVTMLNSVRTGSESEYWNGDGFGTERGTYNITYDQTYAAGSTDAGYDLKSQSTLLINTVAAGNKRNYRIWGEAELRDIISDEPLKQGGIGSASHLWAASQARVKLSNATFSGEANVDNVVFELDENSTVDVDGYAILDDRYRLQKIGSGASLVLKNERSEPVNLLPVDSTDSDREIADDQLILHPSDSPLIDEIDHPQDRLDGIKSDSHPSDTETGDVKENGGFTDDRNADFLEQVDSSTTVSNSLSNEVAPVAMASDPPVDIPDSSPVTEDGNGGDAASEKSDNEVRIDDVEIDINPNYIRLVPNDIFSPTENADAQKNPCTPTAAMWTNQGEEDSLVGAGAFNDLSHNVEYRLEKTQGETDLFGVQIETDANLNEAVNPLEADSLNEVFIQLGSLEIAEGVVHPFTGLGDENLPVSLMISNISPMDL